ncbi:copper homeostasis protein CutC [Lactobacillus gigeriorum]|uniref:PF03932 family protein CutC n=1 Tax=Lactobacillus gigeriorum DSM 23908 = CRBIP 24.85 TaxID=1423751 RepID=I7LDS8_9LACO|nr:copper homeostasis protein CutC [Lactobacillus gigeriorum]KRN09857.1 cytoplasmic copper homeostasis protein CutC [Lactobacillus gigeriorum DSM 23908 = CRBIP 24.85]CCI87581.1 Copper homeostasis protein CutC [Lactobacillus gigeriorum DSM 23908 = CRBIP 24.85]
MLREICVENFTDIPRMIEAGANRIELNNDLGAGGTTPSFGVIKQSIKYAHQHQIPVVVMIRPRGGNFVYNDDEFTIMKQDLQVAAILGADGVALGCLTADKQLDKVKMTELCAMARLLKLDLVLHMAFDELSEDQQLELIPWLVEHDVTRILTHGGPLGTDILDNSVRLKKLISATDGKIEILPGGGITVENYERIALELGVTQVHGTKIVSMN